MGSSDTQGAQPEALEDARELGTNLEKQTGRVLLGSSLERIEEGYFFKQNKLFFFGSPF